MHTPFALICFAAESNVVRVAACSTRVETHRWQSVTIKPAPWRRQVRKDKGAESTVHDIKADNINGK